MRVTTASTFRRVLFGLRLNQGARIRSQEQLSTGRRILRPSDDPTGASRAIQLERQLADVGRFRDSIADGSRLLDAASSALSETSGLMSEARELIVQALNGTLNNGDRRSLGAEMELIREQLLDVANSRSGEHYLFGGSVVDSEPWREVVENGRTRVMYAGDESSIEARIGLEITAEVTLAGSEIFGRVQPTGTVFSGFSGAARGTTVDEGTGYAFLELRHDGTDPGALASVGVALSANGARDTVLGDNAITIDGTARTVTLGTGAAVEIPDPLPSDFVVRNELGAELHLDLTGWSGADYTGTISGAGSVSIDGTSFVSIDYTEADLELVDDATGTTIHVDTTGVKRAGTERVTFGGTTNLFDTLAAITEDLLNEEGAEQDVVLKRLRAHLDEFDRHHDGTLDATGILGARAQRLQVADGRVRDVEVQLQGALGQIADVDLAQVAADLTRSEYLLQIAQASGARLLQTSLINYL